MQLCNPSLVISRQPVYGITRHISHFERPPHTAFKELVVPFESDRFLTPALYTHFSTKGTFYMSIYFQTSISEREFLSRAELVLMAGVPVQHKRRKAVS